MRIEGENERMTPNKHAVFVYDLFRRGLPNHFALKRATLLGEAETLRPYAMYITAIPYVLKTESVSLIRGEAYRVNDDVLTAIDRMQGNGEWFQREEVMIRMLLSGETCRAWMYFFPTRIGRLSVQGDYLEWFSNEAPRLELDSDRLWRHFRALAFPLSSQADPVQTDAQ